jgi:hypothetical protein
MADQFAEQDLLNDGDSVSIDDVVAHRYGEITDWINVDISEDSAGPQATHQTYWWQD